jgi:tetratricopeptide (TPR) repeat protein
VLEGTVVTSGPTVRVTVRVCDAEAGDVIWSEVFDRDADAFTGFGGHDDVVRHVAGLVGDYSGAIQRDALTRGIATSNPAVYAAMQKFYEALGTNTPQSARQLRGALEGALALEPRNPLLLAMLASVASYLAGDGDPADSAANWEKARQYAHEALSIDTQNAHATLVLGRASRGTGGPEAVKRLVRRAIELAPDNPSILYASGVALTEVDEWDEGIGFVRESAHLNPYHPTYRYMYLAIDSMMSGDYAAALVESTIFDRRFEFCGPLLHGLALDGLGHSDEAHSEIDAARELEPSLEVAITGTTDFPEEVRDFLVNRLASARTAT